MIQVEEWTLDGTRQWWCRTCRRFTNWQFRQFGGVVEERCSEHPAAGQACGNIRPDGDSSV